MRGVVVVVGDENWRAVRVEEGIGMVGGEGRDGVTNALACNAGKKGK